METVSNENNLNRLMIKDLTPSILMRIGGQ